MIKLLQMAKLMHYNIVDEFGRQESKLGIEIKILFARTTPPAGSHALYLDVIEVKPVVPIVDINAMFYETKKLVHDLTAQA